MVKRKSLSQFDKGQIVKVRRLGQIISMTTNPVKAASMKIDPMKDQW